MLLADRGLAALPPVAEVAQKREQHVDEQRVAGRRRERPVDDRLRLRLVEPLDRRSQLCPGSGGRERGHDRLAFGPCLRDLGRRFRRREAGCQVLLHEPDAIEVVQGVEPQPAGRSGPAQQSVAPLPGAQQLRAHARALAQLSDPQRPVRHLRLTIQKMDITWTVLASLDSTHARPRHSTSKRAAADPPDRRDRLRRRPAPARAARARRRRPLPRPPAGGDAPARPGLEVVAGDALDAGALAPRARRRRRRVLPDPLDGLGRTRSSGATGAPRRTSREAARDGRRAADRLPRRARCRAATCRRTSRAARRSGASSPRPGVPTIEFRASIVIGSGSLSFEMIRALSSGCR